MAENYHVEGGRRSTHAELLGIIEALNIYQRSALLQDRGILKGMDAILIILAYCDMVKTGGPTIPLNEYYYDAKNS